MSRVCRQLKLIFLYTIAYPFLQDVVFLQEVWVAEDARLICSRSAEGRLKHAHHFIHNIFGSGLVVLSAFPILQARNLDAQPVVLLAVHTKTRHF